MGHCARPCPSHPSLVGPGDGLHLKPPLLRSVKEQPLGSTHTRGLGWGGATVVEVGTVGLRLSRLRRSTQPHSSVPCRFLLVLALIFRLILTKFSLLTTVSFLLLKKFCR